MATTGVVDRPVAPGFAGADAPRDEDLIRCVHCGLCLSVCPTYAELGIETDSPRGRLHLMKAVSGGKLGMSDRFVQHMYRCLDCRACEAVCPSGVRYGQLMEATRAQISAQRSPSGKERVVRSLVLSSLFPFPARLGLLGHALRLYQRMGLSSLLHSAPLSRLLPDRLVEMEALLPPLSGDFFSPPPGEVVRAEGERRHRVAFLSGCVASLVFGETNRATLRVLTRNGCEVVVPRDQGCCGALHSHAGDREGARTLARRNIDVFERTGADFVLTNAGGCGAMLKGYGELLADDPAYAERARRFASQVRDLSEFLVGLPVDRGLGELRWRVTYQDPCHLAHAQGVRKQPRDLLRAVPGLTLVEMAASDQCCGSAGVYNITQPELSQRILDRKMRNVAATRADYVVTANPGCLIQLRQGVRRAGLSASVLHVVDVLDEAYRRHNS